MQKKILNIIIFIILFLTPVKSEIISGNAIIIDGDTIRINNKKVRLHGIDAPEIKQLCQKVFLSIFFIAFNCSEHKKILNSFNKYANALEANYIKDKSLSVFTTNLYQTNDNWILEGETTNLVLHSNLIRFTDSLLTKEGYTNNFILLPDSLLGDSSFAIVNVSVTPLREKPQHSSQMVDQAIMGNTVKLLRYNDGWYLAQTHYDYIGWINKTGLHICDSVTKSNWENKINYTTKNLQGSIFSLPIIL